ncbi:helix-turn-helix transcriptional regulator [Martelella alba]|uniref:Helix-turn-helix transcriptional regulator n=1 Tax=Martelella alba TaxID=2590451 RepID=A0ABY2SQQ0_9HYPH|nr:helix-turn-helix transcriptional regulator [Martelella alba]TKI08532.1 helix-turn-helix transcriptional regulator [Martelella alba]
MNIEKIFANIDNNYLFAYIENFLSHRFNIRLEVSEPWQPWRTVENQLSIIQISIYSIGAEKAARLLEHETQGVLLLYDRYSAFLVHNLDLPGNFTCLCYESSFDHVQQALTAWLWKNASVPNPPGAHPAIHLKNRLTRMETEIMAWLTRGYSITQIAQSYHIDHRTVSRHKRNALYKFGTINLHQFIMVDRFYQFFIMDKILAKPSQIDIFTPTCA